MKKLLSIVSILLLTISLNAQNYRLPTPNADSIPDMVVYDREGNLYNVNDLRFALPSTDNPQLLTITPTCNAGIFRLHFVDAGLNSGFDDPILGPQRQAVACQVFTDLSQLINEANSPYSSIQNLGNGNSFVEIEVRQSINTASNPMLGMAGQYYLSSSFGIIHGTVWETINTGIDSWFGINNSNFGNFGIYHGLMQINFGHPFYLGNNPSAIPLNDFDLYTVILHEALHALGIGSLINQNGTSKFTNTNPGIYSIYDTYLTDNLTGNKLINTTNCYNSQATILPLSKLTTPCSITFDGTSTTFVSSDAIWSNGTSLSHYPIGSCSNSGNYVMNPSLASGITRRFPNIEEVTSLCDIGYSTSGIYASTTYPSIGNCGTRVAGVNDYATYTSSAPGINFQTPFNTFYNFSSSDILGNDENATFYDCLEVVNASGTLTGLLSGGMGNIITFTPNTGYSGVAILKYIPRASVNGIRGNTTYIFILVSPPPLPPCTPNQCEMICYGGFEEFISQLQYDVYTQGSFAAGSANSFSFNPPPYLDNSPDFRNSPSSIPNNLSCGGTGTTGNTAYTGTNFVGLVLRTDILGNNLPEGPSLPLNSPLQPGETATISLWARLGNAMCNGGVEVRFTNIQPCNGGTFLGNCVGLMQSVPLQSASLVNNTTWQQVTFNYTNTTGVNLTYLLINSLPFQNYHFGTLGYMGDILIDDVSCIKNTPNITITKTAPSDACPNDVITYTIDVCNTSTFPANNIQITDILSSGLTVVSGGSFTYPTQTISNLPAGGCQSFTLNAQVNVSAGTVNNTATLSSGGCLSNITTNTTTTTINQPTLNITQVASNINPISGSTITLTVDVCNSTPNTVNNIIVETTVPSGYTILSGSGYTVAGNVITFNSFNLPAGTITTPSCSTFVIPITVNCSGSGLICTSIISGGNVCIAPNSCININVSSPTITITPSAPTICIGQSTTLTASGANTYTWSPATGLSSTTGTNVTANPTTTTTYTVTGTDVNGCSATSSVTVTVDLNCGTCTTCTPIATSGTLSTSPPANQTYCINNDITITGNVNFISSEFKIASNVTITVDATATLNIYGSHLYACDEMWKGIVVKPGGKVTVQSITSSGVNRSSLIEDAFIAIDIPSNSFITNNPLMVRNATFNRNRVAIRITKYSKASGSITYPMSVVNTVFTCRDIPFTPNSLVWPHTNTIKATAPVPPLKSPYINDATFSATNSNAYLKAPFSPFSSKPLAGIVLDKVGASIPVSSPTPTYYEIKIGGAGLPNFNVFDNLNIGIDALRSNFTCINNVFQNNPLNQKNGIAINAIVKEDDNNRLQVIPFANTTNKFYDVGKAVNTVNYFEHLITNCEVRSSRVSTAPSSPTFFNGKYGFYVLTNRFKSINLSTNTMYNIENGITFNANFGSYNVGGAVSNGQYSGQVDINSNIIRPNLPGSPVTTQYVANAITVSNGSSSNLAYIPGSIVNINNNALTDVYRGIASSNWVKKDVKINDNTITLVPDPFTVNPLQYGIGIQANRTLTVFGNSIAGNTVTGFGVTSNAKVRAIITSLCSNQLVRCNNVSKTYKGIEFNGDNAPTSFTKNNMQTHRYGLVLDNNSFIGVQGNSTSPTDNQWLGTWNVPDFKTATLGGSTAIGNTLWVRKPPGAFNPDGSGFSSIFSAEYSNANNTVLYVTNNPIVTSCTTLTPCCPDAGKIARLEQIVQDQELLMNNIAETRYINKNKVHRVLRDEPNLLTESVILQDFYTQSLSTNRENFVTIEDDFAVSNIVNASAKTSSLLVENNIEQNYKTFFESYIKQQTDTFTTADSLTLVTLAMGCPFTDGEVVYQARVLFNAIYLSNVVFEDNCPSGNLRLSGFTENISNKSSTDLIVNIFPNPTTGETTLIMDGESSEWLIVISDIQGRKIHEKTYTTNKINLKLVADNGVYYVQITNIINNETITKKLIINR